MKIILMSLFGTKINNSSFESGDISQFTLDISDFWMQYQSAQSTVYNPIWQSIRWSQFLGNTQSVISIDGIGLYDNEKLVAYAFLESRTIGMGFQGGYIIGGPNIIGCTNVGKKSKYLEELFVIIDQISRVRRNIYTLIEPVEKDIVSLPIPGTNTEKVPLRNIQYAEATKGLVRTFIEPFTRILDLHKTEEELLAEMKPKGRYNIRLAEKNGCRVEKVASTECMLDIFMGLLGETLERDGFHGNNRAYYQQLLSILSHPAEGLYIVYFEDTPIAAAIMTFSENTAVYYYGASTSDNLLRKHMPAYLLQWRMIQAAKAAHCKWYDFLGIANPADEISPLAGVTDFKAKFGGEIWELPKKYIIIHSRYAWGIFRILRDIKKFFHTFLR